MDADAIAFVLAAATLLGGGLGVVLSQKLFHAALFLAATMLSVAVLFLILEAQFLFVAQILVYVGAVVTLILFAIMFTHGSASEEGET